MSKETPVPFEFEGEQLESVLVSRRDDQRRPAVILFPTVVGVSDLEIGFGRELVHLGYSAFVADLYGKRFRGSPREVCKGEMEKLRADRARLRRIVNAVLDRARDVPAIESDAIVAAGYCFGGMCALDLARSGADIAGAVAFHGLFDPPGLPPEQTKAKVVAFHGWDDPLVPPDKVVGLAKELTEAGADWQIHAYGHTAHGFTNPNADKSGIPGVHYNRTAADRAWTAFVNFLEELFG